MKIDQSFAHRIDTHFQKTTPFTRYSTEVKLKWVKAECKTSRKSKTITTWNSPPKCSSRNKKYCPLIGKCLLPSIAYQGKINATQYNYNHEVYFGVVEKLF